MALFAVIILTWAAYLFCIQIFDPLNLETEATIRYRPSKQILIPTRGSIYDSNGNLLVSSLIFYQTDIDRKQVSKWAQKNNLSLDQTYQMLADAFDKHTSLTKEQAYKKLTQNKNLSSIQISNKIKESELEQLTQYLKQKGIPGLVYSFSSMKRIYSRGLTAARILGSVKESNAEYNPEDPIQSMYCLKGSNGLEATYDKELAGQYGWREVFFNAQKKRVNYPHLRDREPVNGLNLWLTIDTSIQDVVEEALAEGLRQYGAKNAAAVVMDVNTGRIYAMAGVSADDYVEDPGYVRVKSNIPVSFLFEPGSTMKPFTALAALDHNLISPHEKFPSGQRVVGRRVIRDTHDYGPIPARKVISKSSNVGISIIGDRVGPKLLYDELIAMGFGQKTDLNIFGESSGIFHKLENWDAYSLHSITFGYAISVTTVQLAAAYAVIANGGNCVKPYIFESFRDEGGRIVQQHQPKTAKRIVSQAAADTMRSYLQSVVEDGTAKHIKLNYVTLAGKTGTAQKKMEGQNTYATGKYTGNFVGFFPVEKPQMVAVIVYDEPEFSLRYGGLCAAPTFQKIVEKTLFLPQCRILPNNRRLQQTTAATPDVTGMSLNGAINILRRNGLTYVVERNDSSTVVADQYPKPNVSLDKSHPIVLVTGQTDKEIMYPNQTGVMPDLTGMTLRKAIQITSNCKIRLKINGIGTVRRQSIIAGTRVTPGSTCTVDATI